MIQRIQSVYLALAAIINGLFVISPLFKKVLEDPSAWLSSIHIAALAFGTAITVYCIFLFKDRPKQAQWVKIAFTFEMIVLGSAFGVLLTLGGIGSYLWDEALSWIGLIISGSFQLLAVRGIQKDDKLVKSMDRIR